MSETNTVKPVYNDHPRDSKFVALLTGGHSSEVGLCYKDLNWDSEIVVAVGRWSLAQVWKCCIARILSRRESKEFIRLWQSNKRSVFYQKCLFRATQNSILWGPAIKTVFRYEKKTIFFFLLFCVKPTNVTNIIPYSLWFSLKLIIFPDSKWSNISNIVLTFYLILKVLQRNFEHFNGAQELTIYIDLGMSLKSILYFFISALFSRLTIINWISFQPLLIDKVNIAGYN